MANVVSWALNRLYPTVARKSGGLALAEGWRRIAVLVTVLWLVGFSVAVTVALFDLDACRMPHRYYNCSEIESRIAWLIVLGVAGPFLLAVLLRAGHWVLRGFKPEPSPLAVEGDDKSAAKQTAKINQTLISTIAARVTADMSGGIGEWNSESATRATAMRSSIVMYAFGLHTLSMARHRFDYMSSDAYRFTQSYVALDCRSHDVRMAQSGLSDEAKKSIANDYMSQCMHIEDAVRDVIMRLGKRSGSPLVALERWFEVQVGTKHVGDLNIEDYTSALSRWIDAQVAAR